MNHVIAVMRDAAESKDESQDPEENSAAVETQPADNERDFLLKWLPWAIIVAGGGLYVVRKK